MTLRETLVEQLASLKVQVETIKKAKDQALEMFNKDLQQVRRVERQILKILESLKVETEGGSSEPALFQTPTTELHA